MTSLDYWEECLDCAADEIDLKLTRDQLKALAKAADRGHENYSMCFYSPPASDMVASRERDSQRQLKQLQSEFDEYRRNAETAVKQALRVHRDDPVSIGEHGEVLRFGGRTERIQ